MVSSKNEMLLISKNIIKFQSYIVLKALKRRRFLSHKDTKKLLCFYKFVKSNNCSSNLRETFFNAFLSCFNFKNSIKLQNSISETLPFLMQSLRRGRNKITRVDVTIWKIIHCLLFKNKFNVIIFRQNNGIFLTKAYLDMYKSGLKKNKEIYNCLKSIKKQLREITDCISTAEIMEARIKLKEEERLLTKNIMLQSILQEKKTVVENNVFTLFNKTLIKLPKLFWPN